MSSLRDLIQKTDDRQLTPVATPEWPEADGKLFGRRLSAAQKVLFYEEVRRQEIGDGADFLAFVVAACACDAEGNPAFETADYLWLRERDGQVIERLFDAIDSLNTLSKRTQKELEKN